MNTERLRLDILGGARYLNLEADLRVGSARAENSGGNWDGIIGFRGDVNLTEKWFLPYHFDVGTTDLTWQGLLGIAYAFKWLELKLEYRHLYYDSAEDKLIDDIGFSGPGLGATFRF